MKFHYSSLDRAVAQLQRSFDYLHSDLAFNDPGLREQFRAATIQAFKFTYELAVNTISGQLAQIAASLDALRALDFADLMRYAADAELVSDAALWLRYREVRNKTLHTYDARKAEEVVAAVGEFLIETRFLLAALRKRNRETA